MLIRRASLLVAVAFVVSACGGATVPVPTPTTGTVTGSVAVVAATAVLAGAGVPALPLRTRLDRPALVPDQLMVKFRPGVASAAAAEVHRRAGGTVLRTIERLSVQVVRLAPGRSAEAAMAAYRASGQIEYVEQDQYAYVTITPNDPSYNQQWHYPQIGLPTAWDVTTGGAVIVAVLDTGTRFDHPDLSGVHVTGYDFVSHLTNGDGTGRDADPTDPGCPTVDPNEYSHGTHVEGTIAARTNNGVGVAGVNWGGVSPTKIMTLRVLGQVMPPDAPESRCGAGSYSDIADAIVYAADRGAKVINMSLGGLSGSATVDNAITYARSAGVTLVAAAGNDSCGPVLYPARNPDVIAVAATTNTNERAWYSNCGPELDVAAPGGSPGAGVLSTTWSPTAGNTYASFQGTSMATPHVAGLIALMISRGITGPANIQSVLQTTATDLSPSGFDTQFGWGLVNAPAAVSGGAAATQQQVFSGVISGSTITVQSDRVTVLTNGTFTITNAQTGTKSVFVWQDFNANGIVDTGDSYGQVNGVVINAGTSTPVGTVTVSRYSGSPLTVGP
jgi:serine protease